MQYNMHAEHDGTITVINIMSRMKHQHQSQHQTPTPNTQQQHQYPNQCQYQYQRYYNCFAESFSFQFFWPSLVVSKPLASSWLSIVTRNHDFVQGDSRM